MPLAAQHFTGPVTAVCAGRDGLVLAGCGPMLRVGRLGGSTRPAPVFGDELATIHGIREWVAEGREVRASVGQRWPPGPR